MAFKGFFQVLSRVKDKNGNSHKLICLYDHKAELIDIVESGQEVLSSVLRSLLSKGYVEIPSIHLSIAEYMSWRVGYKNLLKRA